MTAGSKAPDRCDHCGGEIGYGDTIVVVGGDDGAGVVGEAVAGTCDARDFEAVYHPECYRRRTG